MSFNELRNLLIRCPGRYLLINDKWLLMRDKELRKINKSEEIRLLLHFIPNEFGCHCSPNRLCVFKGACQNIVSLVYDLFFLLVIFVYMLEWLVVCRSEYI